MLAFDRTHAEFFVACWWLGVGNRGAHLTRWTAASRTLRRASVGGIGITRVRQDCRGRDEREIIRIVDERMAGHEERHRGQDEGPSFLRRHGDFHRLADEPLLWDLLVVARGIRPEVTLGQWLVIRAGGFETPGCGKKHGR